MGDFRIEVNNGKYSVIIPEDGTPAYPLRYGESWPAYDGQLLDNLTVALAWDLLEARNEIAQLMAQTRPETASAAD